MSQKILEFRDWKHFSHTVLEKYSALSLSSQERYLFRGQADSRWMLTATLDRIRKFNNLDHRDEFLERLVEAFRQDSSGLNDRVDCRTMLEWELLGRHHGLPTACLDFSRSPYVAAYFAFADEIPKRATHASIWALDLDALDQPDIGIQLIDDPELIRLNKRAIEQRGSFLKIKDPRALTSVPEHQLVRYDIPISTDIRKRVLMILDAMMINGRTLFRDLTGAATSSSNRVLMFGTE